MYFDGPLTLKSYTEISSGLLADFLEDEVSLRDLSRMWYQHDGAPTHKSAQPCTFLAQTFDTRIIGYGGMEWQKCDICKKSFNGIVPFKEHLASEKHKKKLRASKLNITENSKAYLKGYIKCFDCNKICNSPITYEHHLQGKIHKKTIQRKLSVRNNSPLPSPNSALQNPMEWNSETLEKYYCDICKKQCVSRTPYELHVLSRAHRKKAENAEINPKVGSIEESGSSSCSKSVETNAFSNTGEISTIDGVYNNSYCKSPKPYSTKIFHLYSSHEVKDREKRDTGVELFFAESAHHKKKTECNTTENFETHFKCYKRCVDCDKIFTGPICYEQHLQSKRHKKKTEKYWN
ncbi:uncharacterized protein TNCV_1551461 [Trichonephila clavipes]|nr:uncharacterized protein TNCV_1551461 [Trichonephila clavipes]